MSVRKRLIGPFLLATLAFSGAANADVEDNGLSVTGAAGLAELIVKVSGRDDARAAVADRQLQRFTTESDGTYFITQDGHAAHQFVMYCGSTAAGGTEVRAWTSSADTESVESTRMTLLDAIHTADSCSVSL